MYFCLHNWYFSDRISNRNKTVIYIGNAHPPDDNEQHVAHYQKEDIFMPKTKFEDAIYTIIMATIMVYGMIVYNVALNTGGVSGQTFLLATHEMIVMVPVAFVLEFAFVDKLAHMLAFRIVTPQDRPIFITLAISSMIVCIMCPCMSLVATILFKNAGSNVIATWCQTTFMNFPVAFFWQIFYCGPFIRLIFRKMFPEKENVAASAVTE